VTERTLYFWFVWAWAGLAVVTLPVLLVRTAPYGRHTPSSAGHRLPSRLGWLLMEAPAPVVFGGCYLFAPGFDVTALAFLGLWQLHYLNRAFVYPLRMRGPGTPVPLSIVASAFAFNVVNGYLNGRWTSALGHYTPAWLVDPRFLTGAALFVAGFVITHRADETLRGMRQPGETGYRVPQGGLYRWVTCPNYLGEVVEWCGWALATWSPPGLAFALWTIANLAPRALAHHHWYHRTFSEYPRQRRALIPFLL